MRIGRPKFHSEYGIATAADGLVSWEWADERLAAARNYWLVTVPAPGSPPQTSPLWGLWFDGGFVFGTNPDSPKARNMTHDPRVVVHLESGDEVVMLHGRVEPLTAALAPRVTTEYARKYEIELEPGEGWYLLRPSYAHAWLEADYPHTATRFDF